MTMKKISALLLLLITLKTTAQTELSIPESPKKIEFANVIINLDDEALAKVNNQINSLLTPQNAYLDAKLERMQWYFPIIEEILDEEDVPDDIKYIAVVESSLLPDALSTSAAVGFWQFKEATAKEMGLKIDNTIDERKYIVASTRAAALYLKRNNLIFKNWISSIYSYKEGAGGAAKIIPANWSYASEINFDKNTPEYLIKALAHRIAFEHRLNRLRNSPRKLVEYPTRSKSLAEIAVELTTDIAELRQYNAWLLAPSISNEKDYTVLIPTKLEDVEEMENKISKRRDLVKTETGFPQLKRVTMVSTSDTEPVYYEINNRKGILAQPGDEAAQVAAKAGLNLTTFLKLNDMGDRDLIKTGQIYYLEKKSKKAKIPFHTASGKQTMWDISQMYGVRLKDLLIKNRMDNLQRLQPGRVVWMQKKRPKKQPVEIIQEIVNLPETEALPVREEYNKTEKPVEKPKTEEKPVLDEDKPIVKTETPKPTYEKPVVEKPVIPLEEDNEPIVVKREEKPKAPVNKSTPAKSTITETASHQVQKGETLFSISKKYGLSVAELRAMNGMSANDVLKMGQNLKISKKTSVPSSDVDQILAARKAEDARKAEEARQKERQQAFERQQALEKQAAIEKQKAPNDKKNASHTVAAGETVYSIAKKYDLSIEELKQMNALNDNNIYVGQAMKVIKGTSAIPASGTRSHVIQKGETLFSIAKRYNVSIDDLRKWNNINNNEIKAGTALLIR